jgi:hypothetical protein
MAIETDGSVVEDVAVHKVGGEQALPERRAELDRQR